MRLIYFVIAPESLDAKKIEKKYPLCLVFFVSCHRTFDHVFFLLLNSTLLIT